MDDLGQVLRDLNGKAISHRVYYRNDDDGRAYEADPEFFELWRTLESYRKTIPTLRKVLSTDMEYFDLLYGKEN